MNEIKEEKDDIKSIKKRFLSTKWVFSLIAAILGTLIIVLDNTVGKYKKYSLISFTNLSWWSSVALVLAIFFLSFGVTYTLINIKRIKRLYKQFNISSHTKYLISSVILSLIVAITTYLKYKDIAIMDLLIAFSIWVGILMILFEIFSIFNYRKVISAFVLFIKKLFFFVLWPSMFLIIILMGNIDMNNTFMQSISNNLNIALDIIKKSLIDLISILYNLGKDKFSLEFIIAAFLLLILLMFKDFFKDIKHIDFKNFKTREEYEIDWIILPKKCYKGYDDEDENPLQQLEHKEKTAEVI